MALLLPNLRNIIKRATSIADRATRDAVRNLEDWADQLTQRLAKMEAGTGTGTGDVLSTRAINTTAPLTGGGDLSADRTLAISEFTDTVKGAVPPPNNGSDPSYFLAADGTWLDPGANIAAFFGSGDDGDVTISVNTTLTRDMCYNNLTVNTGIELNTGGYRIFVKETLTLNGKIVRNGLAGSASPDDPSNAGGAGAAALAAGSLPGSTAGGAGGAAAGGATGTGGASATRYAGLGTGAPTGAGGAGQGGAGGANSGATAGGAGGNCTEGGATSGSTIYNLMQSITGRNLAGDPFTGASGGGGGRGSPNAGERGGGGGGSGGGYVVVCANICTGGTVEAKGGAGGAVGAAGGTAQNAGGGGGGGGGTIIFVIASGPYPTLDVSGGPGGAAGTGGVNGYAGGAGHTEQYRLRIAGGGGGGGLVDGDYGDITVGGVGTTMTIDTGVVTASKLATDAVTAVKIAAGAVTTAKIAASAITPTELATDSVTTAKILANNVTLAKLAQIATARFLGRTTAATGNVEELTGTQATAMLDAYTGSAKGLVPAGAGSTTKFLREDGTWTSVAGSGGGLYSANIGTVPTSSGTGINAWAYQPASATVTDASSGIIVYAPNVSSAAVRCATRYKAVPSTPYTVTALFSVSTDVNTNAGGFFGWCDGTTSSAKLQAFVWKPQFTDFSVTNFPRLDGTGGATSTVKTNTTTINVTAPPYWFRLTDDGTTARYWLSPTGDTDSWIQYTAVTKSGSFLGSSGFSNLAFGAFGFAGDARIELLSWSVT